MDERYGKYCKMSVKLEQPSGQKGEYAPNSRSRVLFLMSKLDRAEMERLIATKRTTDV